MTTPMRSRGTGTIKKVFPRKRDPYGFINVLSPLKYCNSEAAFFLSDIALPSYELFCIKPGLVMQFDLVEKPRDYLANDVPFKAVHIEPLDVMEQRATLIRGPLADGSGSTAVLVYDAVRVTIRPDSWVQLAAAATTTQQRTHMAPLPDDAVIVRLQWKQYLQACIERRQPTCDVVRHMPLNPPLTGRRRSVSSRRRYVAKSNVSDGCAVRSFLRGGGGGGGGSGGSGVDDNGASSASASTEHSDVSLAGGNGGATSGADGATVSGGATGGGDSPTGGGSGGGGATGGGGSGSSSSSIETDNGIAWSCAASAPERRVDVQERQAEDVAVRPRNVVAKKRPSRGSGASGGIKSNDDSFCPREHSFRGAVQTTTTMTMTPPPAALMAALSTDVPGRDMTRTTSAAEAAATAADVYVPTHYHDHDVACLSPEREARPRRPGHVGDQRRGRSCGPDSGSSQYRRESLAHAFEPEETQRDMRAHHRCAPSALLYEDGSGPHMSHMPCCQGSAKLHECHGWPTYAQMHAGFPPPEPCTGAGCCSPGSSAAVAMAVTQQPEQWGHTANCARRAPQSRSNAVRISFSEFLSNGGRLF